MIKLKINWAGWDINNLFYYGTRFNSGIPYYYIRVGPIMIRKYL
jgi:hypothetical protein